MIAFDAVDPVTVSCGCAICHQNAADFGIVEPMSATVSSKQGQKHEPHFIVHTAFDPSAPGRALRRQFRIEPVGYTHKSEVEVLADAWSVIAEVQARNAARGS